MSNTGHSVVGETFFVWYILKLSGSTSLLLKGLGHAILGNFSTDQIVIELTKI